MSEKIKKAIAKNIVKPQLESRAKPQIGTVRRTYTEVKNTKDSKGEKVDKFNLPVVDVEIVDDNENEPRILTGVPILHNALSSNIDGRKLHRGDRVLVSFYKDNDSFPYILGRVYVKDDELEKEMKLESGVYKSSAKGYF